MASPHHTSTKIINSMKPSIKITLNDLRNFFSNFTKDQFNNFERYTDEIELKNMEIDFNSIDFLFDIECTKNDDGYNYSLIARQNYNGNSIYVDLNVYEKMDGYCSGDMTFSKDPDVFLKNVKFSNCMKEEIYTYLENVEHFSFNRIKFYCESCKNTFISRKRVM